MQVKNIAHISLKLSLFAILITLGGLLIYSYWTELVIAAQSWQRYFHKQLIALLIKTKTDGLQTGLLLMSFSFLYGILHSAGPGHGKFIITTYLATQPKQLKKSLQLTILSSLMQALVAIVVISLMLIVLKLSTKYLKISEYWLMLTSYILIILVGLFLCYKAAKKLLNLTKFAYKQNLKIQKITRLTDASNTLTAQHNSCACCNYHVLSGQNKITRSTNWLDDLAIILAVGVRPCSGALLVLIFSFTMGSYYWGIMATLAMAIGTSITTSFFALLVHYARKFAEYLLRQQSSSSYQIFAIIIQFIGLVGGLVFILMGLILIVGIEHSVYATGNPLFAK
ncbi:nickel/cobalt transporter [Orbus wheelerorum]|uniref:nickel/cobalt transporter n=1 Tax=Orbus wheelerorum TaxID=3074111 RepID=UPI00370D5680